MKHVKLLLLLYFYNFVTQQKLHTSPTFTFELQVAQNNIALEGYAH